MTLFLGEPGFISTHAQAEDYEGITISGPCELQPRQIVELPADDSTPDLPRMCSPARALHRVGRLPGTEGFAEHMAVIGVPDLNGENLWRWSSHPCPGEQLDTGLRAAG